MVAGLCHYATLQDEKLKRRYAERRKDEKRHAKRRNSAMRKDEKSKPAT